MDRIGACAGRVSGAAWTTLAGGGGAALLNMAQADVQPSPPDPAGLLGNWSLAIGPEHKTSDDAANGTKAANSPCSASA